MLPDEMQPPKTKFVPQDKTKEVRSTFTSRLKSFPAEKIRKLDNVPVYTSESADSSIMQQDLQENNLFANSIARSNNGQGDAISTQYSPFYQQPKVRILKIS